jgi:hypothetical protein
MTTEFDLILEDFEVELTAIEGMLASLAMTGDEPTSARSRIAGANAATLLLAAAFEEFARQEVRAVFVAKAARARGFADFPEKIFAAVWRRSLERLSRSSLDDLSRDVPSVDGKLTAAIGFCLTKDITADVSDAVAHNDQNMRPAELNRLFSQLGVKNMCARACEYEPLVAHLGCDSPGKANSELQVRVEDFFRRRNEIAHAIQLNSSTGAPGLAADITLFREFGKALAVESAKAVGQVSALLPKIDDPAVEKAVVGEDQLAVDDDEASVTDGS